MDSLHGHSLGSSSSVQNLYDQDQYMSKAGSLSKNKMSAKKLKPIEIKQMG